MQPLKEINTDRCLKLQLHAFSDGGEDAFKSCVFIGWPTACGIEIRFVAAKVFVAPLTLPDLKVGGSS